MMAPARGGIRDAMMKRGLHFTKRLRVATLKVFETTSSEGRPQWTHSTSPSICTSAVR
jgi:hypothetical protein